MKKFTLSLLLAMACLSSYATFAPIALTGYNADVISNGAAAASSSISSFMIDGFDSAGYAFVAEDYSSSGYTPTYFLPTGGSLASTLTTGLTFQLADYSSNNAARLRLVGDSCVLSFVTPQSAGALYMLGTSGSGTSTVSFTVNFSDGTTETFTSISYPDWYSSGGSINAIGRVSTTDDHTDGTSTSPSLFERLLTIDPSDYSKTINSITVKKTGGLGITAIMAASSEDICSGTPVAGSVAATQLVGCTAFTTTLSLSTGTTAGLSYQWQSSTDSLTWTDVSGATDATYTASISVTNTYYRAYVVCSIGGASDTAVAAHFTITSPAPVVATLPFFEGFESWIGACYSFDRPSTNWLTSPATGDSSWRRDDEGSDASWDALTSYGYTPTSTEGSHSARFHSGYTHAGIKGIMDLYVDFSATGTKSISFDYINESGSDELNLEISTDGGVTFSPLSTLGVATGWTSELVTTTATASSAILRFRAVADYGSSDIGIDSLYIYELPSCSGTPTAGTISATRTTGCSTYSSTLTVDAPVYMTGLGYQWQSSTDGISFTDVSGATAISYTATVTANVYYRVYASCSISGLGDTSAATELVYTTPVATVATLPFFEGFESWIGTCFSFDRPSVNWLTNPSTGDSSWRRDDQGADASWDNLDFYGYTPTSTEGSHSARFHSGYTHAGLKGIMDLYVDLSAAGTKSISFDYINEDGFDNLYLEISTDGGATFSPLSTFGVAAGWTSEVVTTTATASSAILRFRAVADYGSTDIGIDSLYIYALPSCSGTPTVGTISATTTTGCTSYSSTLTVDAPVYMTGLGYQWQSSTDGVSFTDVTGATGTSYTATVTASVYYRVYASCSISGLGDTSAATELVYAPAVATIATVPFFEGFESWIGTCFTADRPGINWLVTPTSGDNSWRRDDEGTDASWDAPTGGSYSPVSTDASHSARFHSYETYGEGDMDLYIDLSTPGTKQISFDYRNNSGDDQMVVQLSEDGGTTFTDLATFTTASSWTNELVTTSSVSASAIIRFAASGDDGSSDIGMDSLYISVLPSCSGTPVAGTISATATTGCVSYTSTLSVDAPILLTGISYQWQTSTDGISFSNVSGATGTSYTATVASNVYYRVYVSCSISGFGDTSSATELLYAPPAVTLATVPFFEGFESWIGGCYTYDRPGVNWLQSQVTGNTSWRRDDQGSDASWDAAGGGSYDPTFTEGSHSARFHSYEADAGTEGDLDLHINLNTPGTKQISFDYINADGDDFVDVQLSEDGGATFTDMATFTTTSGWENEVLTTSSVATNAVIRFAATSDFGGSDIGLDSIYISVSTAPTPCDAALSLVASAITTTSATLTWDAVTAAAGYDYVLDTTAADPTTSGTFTTGSTFDTTGLACSTTYYLHVRTACATDSASWSTISFSTALCTIPVCLAPTGLTVTGITSSAATVSWNAVAGASGYEYVINTAATDPATGTPTTDTTITDTTLTCSTVYYLHVRTDCAGDTSAVWSTLSFGTVGCLGVANVSGTSFDITAHPNPASETVTVEINGTITGKASIQLTDVTGKIIQTLTPAAQVRINVSNLAAGIYFVNYTDDIHKQTLKINKQ